MIHLFIKGETSLSCGRVNRHRHKCLAWSHVSRPVLLIRIRIQQFITICILKNRSISTNSKTKQFIFCVKNCMHTKQDTYCCEIGSRSGPKPDRIPILLKATHIHWDMSSANQVRWVLEKYFSPVRLDPCFQLKHDFNTSFNFRLYHTLFGLSRDPLYSSLLGSIQLFPILCVSC